MDFNPALAQGQRALKQRNALAIVAPILALLVVVLVVVGVTRDRKRQRGTGLSPIAELRH